MIIKKEFFLSELTSFFFPSFFACKKGTVFFLNLFSRQLFLSACLFLFSCSSLVQAKTIVVFIHGTVLPGLSLLDMSGVCKDSLNDSSRYVAAAQCVRNDTRFWEDQAVLGEGLWPIMTIKNQEQKNTCQREERFAVYPLTRAFDAVAQWAGFFDGDVAYYAFGHLGLLSQTYRKEQGYALYKELISLVHQSYEPVRVVICAHSHGGNIALYLAEAEKQFHQGLCIDELLLFGTPVQLETAYYAFQKPFKRVISFFSASDTVQLSDWLSTKSLASFRTFTVPHRQGTCRYRPPQTSYGQVIDVRCQVNGDARCLTHQNFWYLGRSRRICMAMDLLPLMVLAPVYVTLLRSSVSSYKMLVDAHLDCTNGFKRTSLKEKTGAADSVSSCEVSSCSGEIGSSLASAFKPSSCITLSCSLVFPDKQKKSLSESESQQLGKLVQLYDRDTHVTWKPMYKHRVLLFYREDFMREMLGLFSWLELKVRMWGYKTLQSMRSFFGCEQLC